MNREQFTNILMSREQAPVQSPDEELEAEHFFKRLREEVRRLNDAEQFEILFPIAVKQQWNAPSYTAALFLRELSPACPLSCEDAIKALFLEWDVSIEEVPFYLAAKFGPARLKQAITELESEVTDKSHKTCLQTVSYWLGVYEATYQPISG